MAKKSQNHHQICSLAANSGSNYRFLPSAAMQFQGLDKEKRPRHQEDATGADPTEHRNVFFA
jgi:hypothetical protein